MEFKKINEFVYLSNCYNYQIRVTSAGKKNTYQCFRYNPELLSTWENISEAGRTYPLYQEALTRVLVVHEQQPELACRADPSKPEKARLAVYEDNISQIRALLRA